MFRKDQNNNKNCFYSSKMAGEAESTRNIAADYIRYRLQHEINHEWENGRGGNISPTQVQLAMRQLGDEFEDRFRAGFDNMIQLNITENNAYETFSAIINEIFNDGVNWGRIVALFGFAAKFSVLCVEKNIPDTIGNVVDWVTDYVDNDIRLRDWMSRNNGWEGFLRFHDGPDSRSESGWPNMRTIGGYALAGLGVITLGAFLTQRS